ncbi:MAG TPA: lytic murein transglycosylase [Stellaceae bacterium]|nr:lytic murein transglycosylase [Stellaceae bacterium]
MAPLRVSRRLLFAAPVLAAPSSLSGLLTKPARAAEEGFGVFLAEMRRDALAAGIRAGTVDFALRYARYLPHVIALDQRQPERTLSFAEYLDKVVTPERIADARRHLADNRLLLDGIAERYGVDAPVIVALWGVETDFGKVTGNYWVVSSLATLAYQGRRSPYFRRELIAALRILDEGDVRADRMLGSWAGAMGQCQFMPSTFLRYAVDYDGRGRRDIWSDRADVLASIANFIAHLGWRMGESWGQEVVLPDGFDMRFAGLEVRQPIAAWRRLGVRDIDDRVLPEESEASLVLPDGEGGAAYLVFDNFRVIMRWNKSTYFATAVGYLTDSMARA